MEKLKTAGVMSWGCQVLSLTPTALKHFGPLKGWVGWGGGGGLGPKINPVFEPPWCRSNIHSHTPRAATSRYTHAKSNLADHLKMIFIDVLSHKPCSKQSGRDAVA